MRIGLISTTGSVVRRHNAGSIETLVWSLAQHLHAAGHEVTTFAAAGSELAGRLVATVPGPYAKDGSLADWQLCEWVNLTQAIKHARGLDVLHSHVYTWGIPLQEFCPVPMVHTTHVMPADDDAELWRSAPQSVVIALSATQWSAFPHLRPAAIVHHGVDTTEFAFEESPGDYLCYLGRFSKAKGVLQAIAAARALDMRLLLAGPHNEYFDVHVRPLVDGRTVEYVGSVTAGRRIDLLQRARALLYPIRTPEPFGLVMTEAMMCGTPVAAVGIGAVPEIVAEGITGITAPDIATFSEAIRRSLLLNRHQVHAYAREHFSAEKMAAGYSAAYERVLAYV
jgi:glycosyltransferase involved in cell wall biosynthesis